MKSKKIIHVRNYRPDIDGLRAVAVLLVVGYHAFPTVLTGGFVGVDIFFVISGYLITRNITDGLLFSEFSFVDFYSRRIRRILPSLITILLFCLILGWFVLRADEYKQLGKHIIGGSLFSSNIYLWMESGYFDEVADKKPLLHLWSLSVEEQFYLLIPILLVVCYKKKYPLFYSVMTMATMSIVLSIYTSKNDPVAAFYSPFTRFWEILIGSALALIQKNEIFIDYAPDIFDIKRELIRSLLGLIFVLYSGIYITKKFLFPGYWALLPTLGAAFLISGRYSWINRNLLSRKFLVQIGTISYPLYLWHWTLLSFARVLEGDALTSSSSFMLVALSFVLSWITYKYIEKPLRYGSSVKNSTSILIISLVFIGFCGGVVFFLGGYLKREVAQRYMEVSLAKKDWAFPEVMNTPEGFYLVSSDLNKNEITFFIGDSNIQQYYPRIKLLINEQSRNSNSAIFTNMGGCSSIPNVFEVSHLWCAGILENALREIKVNKKITKVVIGSYWPNSLTDTSGFYYLEEGPIRIGNKAYNLSLESLSNYIKKIKEIRNLEVYLVLNMPYGESFDPGYYSDRSLSKYFPFSLQKRGGLSVDDLNVKYGKIRNDLTEIASSQKIKLIDPVNYLCDKNYCQSVDENKKPIYKDGAHLRATFVRDKVFYIDETIVK